LQDTGLSQDGDTKERLKDSKTFIMGAKENIRVVKLRSSETRKSAVAGFENTANMDIRFMSNGREPIQPFVIDGRGYSHRLSRISDSLDRMKCGRQNISQIIGMSWKSCIGGIKDKGEK
jgi:hypothetical protein